MAPPYWKTDRVNNITSKNLIRSINFLKNFDGGMYSDLTQNAIEYFHKPNGSPYFGQLVTHMNILGLFIRNANGTFSVSKLANLIYLKNEIANSFLDYILVKFQFPRPHLPTVETTISKPYFIILEILFELWKKDINQAYLTQKEFYHLFENEIKSIDSVNETLINRILDNDRAWGKGLENIESISGKLSYDKSFFSNSDFITAIPSDYPQSIDFFIGLTFKKSSINFLNYLINHYKNVVFDYLNNLTATSDQIKNQWSEYLHDENDFFNYLNTKNMLQHNASFKEFCSSKGFYYTEDLIRRFLTSLSAKPFLLLTGISGTGKSKIAELFGNFLNSINEGSLIIKAVGSNWNDNKNLLGYFNPIIDNEGRYIETDVVKFIRESNENPHKLYILLLDEMNLSYTERYFSDFLSALESLNKEITLADGSVVKWSGNLKIIGTINEDETTHTLSPKVIDRANIIEMNGSLPSVYLGDLRNRNDIKIQNLITQSWHEEYIAHLDNIHNVLEGKFGYRTIDEITNYVIINSDYTQESYLKFLDEQIYQKLLPKLYGTRGELLNKLESLHTILKTDQYEFSLSDKKVLAMIDQVKKTGFTSFVSA